MKEIFLCISILLITICYLNNSFAQNIIHSVVNQPPCTVTSIKEYKNVDQYSVYPNPINDKLKIELAKPISASVKISICINNILGEIVFQQEEITTNGNYLKEVDFSNHPQGIYFIAIREDNIIQLVQKIIKK